MSGTNKGRIALVYNANSGVLAILVDVAKKAIGVEDCDLCEITHGPLGKRGSWKQCEQRLALPFDQYHRNDMPASWGLTADQLPCVVWHDGDRSRVLVSRSDIAQCKRNPVCLQGKIEAALQNAAA